MTKATNQEDEDVKMCCYTKRSLSKDLQSFSRDHELLKQGNGFTLGSPFTTKAVLVGILLWINFYIAITYNLLGCAKELTHWSLWMTTAQVMISLKCSMDTQIEKK